MDVRAVDRAEMVLGSELLNLKGKLDRTGVKESKEGYVVVSLQYDQGVTLDFINEVFGRILNRTSHKGPPVDLFTYPTRIVQLNDSLYPNPMHIETVTLHDDFSETVPEGQPLKKKLGYTVVIRAPHYFPQDIWESLATAVKGGRSIDVSKLGEGFKWFHDSAKKAIVIPQSRGERVRDYPDDIDFLDVRIEGHVRDDEIMKRGGKYDLIAEINEYYEGFRDWIRGNTPAPAKESRNSVDRFLRNPESREFRVWLEQQRRAQEIGDEKEIRDQIKEGKLKTIGDYLDAGFDINDMNSALSRTPPGAQLRPLLPYVFFRGVLFEEETPVRRVQHGAQSRMVTFYRVRYDGRFLTNEEREEAFSPKGANFTPNIEENSAVALN